MERRNLTKDISGILNRYVLVLVLVLCVVVFSLIRPVFLSPGNLVNILLQNSYLVIATVGVALIMISGGTDLSVSYEIALSGVLMAIAMMWWKLPIGVAVVLGIVISIIASTINGLLSIKLNIHPMMTTLATMMVFQGIVYIITGSQSIYNLPSGFKFLGQGFVGPVPFSFIIMVIMVALASFLLNKTYLGRYTYAIGSNADASRLAGINVGLVKVGIFAIGGFIMGISTMILLARAGSATPSMALGTEFNCITACVLGGISLKGGEGKLWGAVIGVFILGVLANGMQLIGLGIYPQYIAKGIILLASIGFDTYQKSKG
ncbi:sugar ABC transporter permease [Spirochaetia bacterium]|nr:sugar ABC transporter permease [Spirochaetia bacterium]